MGALGDRLACLANNGANTHVTTNPKSIANPQLFNGKDTPGVGNGASLVITSTGSSLVYSNSSNVSAFHLKDIARCPDALTNLLSTNKFCRDNKCFFILTNSYFFVKDTTTSSFWSH